MSSEYITSYEEILKAYNEQNKNEDHPFGEYEFLPFENNYLVEKRLPDYWLKGSYLYCSFYPRKLFKQLVETICNDLFVQRCDISIGSGKSVIEVRCFKKLKQEDELSRKEATTEEEHKREIFTNNEINNLSHLVANTFIDQFKKLHPEETKELDLTIENILKMFELYDVKKYEKKLDEKTGLYKWNNTIVLH